MKSVAHIILATMLSTGTAIAQDTVNFDRYDTNSDGYLTSDEWDRIGSVVIAFESADTNRDRRLDEPEVESAVQQSQSQNGNDADRQANIRSGEIDRTADEPDIQTTSTDTTDKQPDVLRGDVETTTQQQTAVSSGDTADQPDIRTTDTETTAAREETRSATTDRKPDEPEIRTTDADTTTDVQAAETTRENQQTQTDSGSAGTATEGEAETGIRGEEAAVSQPDLDAANVDNPAVRETDSRAQDSDPTNGSPDAGMQEMGQRVEPTGTRGLESLDEESLQVFQQTDADSDRLISKEEAKQAGQDYVAIYFDALDENSNGYLEAGEWNQDEGEAQALPGIRDNGREPLYEEPETDADTQFDMADYATEEGVVRFRDDFNTYDANNDGYINRPEAVDTDWIDINLFERSDINDDGLIDIGEAEDGFMEWDDDEDAVTRGSN